MLFQIKLWKKMFLRLLNVSMVNCHILYRSSGAGQLPFKEFVVAVIHDLLGEQIKNALKTISTQVRRVAAGLQAQEGQDRHVIRKLAQVDEGGARRKKRKDCAHCSDRITRKRTIFYCPSCPNLPGLHPECFWDYHL